MSRTPLNTPCSYRLPHLILSFIGMTRGHLLSTSTSAPYVSESSFSFAFFGGGEGVPLLYAVGTILDNMWLFFGYCVSSKTRCLKKEWLASQVDPPDSTADRICLSGKVAIQVLLVLIFVLQELIEQRKPFHGKSQTARQRELLSTASKSGGQR